MPSTKSGLAKTHAKTHKKQMDSKEVFLKSFARNLGHISKSCKAANVSRRSYYLWVKDDPEFVRSCNDVKEAVIDVAESQLLRNVKRGYEKSIFFMLDRQARHRGYGKEETVNVKTTITVTLVDDEEPDGGS